MKEKIFAGSSKLFDFYYKLVEGPATYFGYLYVKERNFSGTSWSAPFLIQAEAISNSGSFPKYYLR